MESGVRESRASDELRNINENVQLREQPPVTGTLDSREQATLYRGTSFASDDPFISLLGQYLNQLESQTLMSQAGVLAQRRRSTGSRYKRRRSIGTQTSPPQPQMRSNSLVSPLLQSEVSDITPLQLHAFMRDRRFKGFTELLRLLDQRQLPGDGTVSHMVVESLQAYLRSPEHHQQPEKLVSALQEAGCTLASKVLTSSPKRKKRFRYSTPSPSLEVSGSATVAVNSNPFRRPRCPSI